MRASTMRSVRITTIVGFAVILCLSGTPALPHSEGLTSRVHTSAGSNIGDGFYTLTSVQKVTGAAYLDNFNCPSQAQFRWCVDAIGVAYIPSSNVVIISEERCPPNLGCNGSRNALAEVLGSNTSLIAPLLMLGCIPGVPFYPGFGDDYYVPCTNESYGWQTILSVDYRTDAIVTNISVPAGANPLAYDPSNGMIYSGQGSELSVIDPTTGATETTMAIAHSTFESSIGESWYTLVYDPATNTLIVPSSKDQVLSVNPSNGSVEASISMPGAVQALAVDPATNQLFASYILPDESATNASAVTVFDATTLALEARFTIPSCVENICTKPDVVGQILMDPGHGDAYLVGETALFALNLTSLSLAGAIEDYGEGYQESTTFVTAADAVVGTWWFPGIGPGFLVLIDHGIVTSWTSFLWLPPTLGELTVILVAVVAVALVSYRIVRNWWKSRRKRSSSLPTESPNLR